MSDPLLTLLPDNSTAYEQAQSATDQRLLDLDTDVIRREREAATCTATFLPFLAWERSVHHWTGTDDALDRARVAASFADHAGYGSPAALEAELQIDLAYAAVAIREWFEVRGLAWPDFAVAIQVLADGPAYPGYVPTVAATIRRKNVRDWPERVLYEARTQGPLGLGSAEVLNGTLRLLPYNPDPARPPR